MAISGKTPPVPPTIPDYLLGPPKGKTTTPVKATTPTTIPGAPIATTESIPSYLTSKPTAASGSTLPIQPVPRNIGEAELRGARRDLRQATRAAKRYGVPEQTVQNITEQKEPNFGLKALGAVLNTPVIKYGVLKPLEVADIGRRAVVGALSDEVGIMEAIKDPTLSSKEAFNINTGNKFADFALGFATDVLLDPITYATFGTGGFVKSAASGLAREGAMVTTKGIARTAIKEAGEAAVKAADEGARFAGTFLDDAERAAIRKSAEATARESEELLVRAAPKAGTPGAAAVKAAETAQRIGPRRAIGARSREELAQGAREIRDVAIQSGNEYVARTLTDDVIADLATRGYSAARGDVARALGLRGGIRWGVGPAKVIVPGTERIADTFGSAFTALRIGAKTPLNDLPYLRNSLAFINKGFVGTRLGNAIVRNVTPIGEGGLFGSDDILRMRTALRTGQVEGRKLAGKEADNFVKLLAQDNAYRGLSAAARTDAQQILRPIYSSDKFQKYSNTVFELLDNPGIGDNLATMTAADATAAVGRTVDDVELQLAKDLRTAGDEFYERANYLYQRAQLMAGKQPDLLEELPKNKAWFPHTLSEKARRAVYDNKVSGDALAELGVDRTFALAGSNLRQLKVGALWFGRKLTQEDINGGVRRLNELARPTLGFDFFETNAQRAFDAYAKGWARDTSYTNFLYNMALATEARRGLTDTPLGNVARAYGAGQFAGKAFEGDVTQEAAQLITGVKAPSKLNAFADSINDVITPEKMRALDNIPELKTKLQQTADEIASLRAKIEKKNVEGELVFSDTLNQTLNDIEQRIFELDAIAPTGSLPAGYGAAISSEADALLQSLRNEADGLRLAINSVPAEKWANTVPLFLDTATRFLQINSINYPGLIGSPELTELLQNVKRLEDPAVARALQKSIGPITQMFKGWVTATPGFHIRNALSNTFFMFSAGANPVNVAEATRIYAAYTKFLKRQGLWSEITDDGIREGVIGPTGAARTARAMDFTAPPEVFSGQTVLSFLASPEAAGLNLDRILPRLTALGEKTADTPADVLTNLLTQSGPGGFGMIGDIFENVGGRVGVTGRTQTRSGVLPSLSRAAGKPLGLSRDFGNKVETWSRFALLYDGLKQGLSPQEAANRTKKYLLDYSDLSRTDQVMRQIIPFWMWTSRSFPLILESSWANPRAYAVWNNATRNMRDEEAEAGMVRPPYLLPAVPVGGNVLFNPDFGYQRREEGLANLTDPRSILAGLTPVLRAPLEAGLNQEFRTGDKLYNEYYQDPVAAGRNYILQQYLPQLGALGRLGNVGIGTTQAAGQAAGAAGQQDLQAILEQIAAAPQTQLPESVRAALGLGKPAYIQEEQGTMTPEESRQRLLSFFGVPVTQLQPWQQTQAIKQIIERLEQETSRAKIKREEERKKR